MRTTPKLTTPTQLCTAPIIPHSKKSAFHRRHVQSLKCLFLFQCDTLTKWPSGKVVTFHGSSAQLQRGERRLISLDDIRAVRPGEKARLHPQYYDHKSSIIHHTSSMFKDFTSTKLLSARVAGSSHTKPRSASSYRPLFPLNVVSVVPSCDDRRLKSRTSRQNPVFP